MVRKRLIATVAVAPLLLFAGSAFAETTISNTRTTGVTTATVNNGAPDDIKVATGGKFELTAGGPAITQNSNNNVTNGGTITTKAVDNAVGILVDTTAGPITGNVTNSGNITHDDDYTPKDEDNDGNFDGDFAKGTNRYGIRVIGPGGLNGSILNSGSITVDGNNSAGISVESDVAGTIRNYGSITITGTNVVGTRITGDVAGGTTAIERAQGVFIAGSTTVRGLNAIGLDVSGDIGTNANPTSLVISGPISASGYRYISRPFLKEDRDNLDPDDLLQGGPAVRISGNVTGGVQVALPFSASTYDLDGDGKVNSVDDDDDGDGVKDSDDTDDDNDGVLDTADTDYDNDGIPDGSEGSGAISVFGKAPGMLIGSETAAINIGNVGTGDKAYGLYIAGSVTSDGVYDNIRSTAIQLGIPIDLNDDGDFADAGESPGQQVELNGGVRVSGTVGARSYNSDARGLWLRGDVDTDALYVDGAIVAIASTTSAPNATETKVDAVAIDIGAAASAPTINIDGIVTASGQGEQASAYGIRDASNTVANITIKGTLAAIITPNDDADDTDDTDLDPSNEVIKGRAIAIDLSGNTLGATVILADKGDDGDDGDDDVADADSDGDKIDDADEPAILGAVKFGSGDDKLILQNGSLVGDMSFGLGNDELTISGSAKVFGGLFNGDASGGLDIAISGPVDSDPTDNIVKNSRLTITNTGAIQVGDVTVGAGGQIFFTVDPNAAPGSQSTLLVGDTVQFQSGSTIGLNLAGLIESDDFVQVGSERIATYKVVDANTLTYTGVNSAVSVNAPFFYKIEAVGNETTDEVTLKVQRKSATEMGLSSNQGAALDAIYEALFADDELANAFLTKSDEKDFLKLYDQLLPDQGEGLFSALDNATQALFRLTATRPDMGQKYGPDSVWVQEINVGVLRETGVTIGSETKAFGFIAGYESMDDAGGALGATLAYMNAEEKDDVAQIGEQTNVSLLEAGVYWRRNMGGWLFAARGALGYGWFEGERRFIDPATATSAGVLREASANWGGFTGSANAMVAYEARFGRFYVRPQVSLDYLYLAEGERDEDGDIGLGLTVDERNSSRLSVAAELAFGATFGRDNWWRPELRLGYRQHLAGEIGDTVARFDGGSPFSLVATEPGEGAVVVGFSLKAGTPMSYVAVEGDLESAEGEDRYNLRLAGRMMF